MCWITFLSSTSIVRTQVYSSAKPVAIMASFRYFIQTHQCHLLPLLISIDFFFQVINHGVSKETVSRIVQMSHEFFDLSVEDKMKLYSDDPSRTMRLSSSFNVNKETVHNWRDYLRLHCYPLDKYMPEWPDVPSSFK